MLTPAQTEARRRGIGGSDVAAIAGLSPWRTPLDVYLDKVEGRTQEETPAMRWGSLLEDTVAREYARTTGNRIQRVNRVLAHPKHPFILASLDRKILAHPDGPGVLEIKTVGRLSEDWGEPGSDRLPEHYALQVHQYLLVTGHAWAHLAALFLAERELRVYRLEADADIAAWLIELEGRFWREHVAARIPPPPQSQADLAALYPRDRGTAVVASPEQREWVTRLTQVKRQLAGLEKEKEHLETGLKAAMGTAATLTSASGLTLATWKTQASRRLDQKALREAEPSLSEAFMVPVESRVFRLKEQGA